MGSLFEKEKDCKFFTGVYSGIGFVLLLNPVATPAGLGLMVLGSEANAFLC